MSPPKLNNTYWLLRHGKSLANEKGIIISKKINGLKTEYGLADEGRKQAMKAGQTLEILLKKEQAEVFARGGGEDEAVHLMVYSSPFSRTVETAHLAASLVECLVDVNGKVDEGGINFMQLTDKLVERDFGDAWEGKPCHDGYEVVWRGDAESADNRAAPDGESLQEVSDRVKQLFRELEEHHKGRHILLVSHGDTLSILQATMEGADLKEHRRFAFENCELRKLGAGPAKTT